MKKIFLIIMGLSVWGVVGWHEYYTAISTPVIPIPEVSGLEEIEKGDKVEIKQIDPIVEKIQEENGKIKSLTCRNLTLKILQNGKAFTATGFLYYEKEKNFRMKLNSFRGLELDMGSNDTHFWFWSKSMSPVALYYARHEFIDKTRLRDPFNPIWIMRSLGVDQINPDSKFVTMDDKIYANEDVKSARGKELIRSCIIDKETKTIFGYYLFNKDNTFVTITNIERDAQNIPSKIYTSWKEEDVAMEFIFHDLEINKIPKRGIFAMPNHFKKIDMENY